MAKKRRKKVASRGSVNNIILKTLTNGDKYGYEIIKEVEEFSEGKIKLKQPSLYSSLNRFEEKKFVSSYWRESDIGGKRHYYHLTDIGLEYYKKFVLKEDIENDDDLDDIISDDILDNSTLDSNIVTNDNDIINSKNSPIETNNNDSNNNIEIKELDENSLPSFINFNNEKETINDQDIIPDHHFYTTTPLELFENDLHNSDTNLIDNNEIKNSEEDQSISISDSNNDTTNINSNSINHRELINTLREKTKVSNKKALSTQFKKLYIKKPKKVQKIILDSDGIYKLRDEDYVPIKKTYTPEIIDNVVKRTKSNNTIFGYTSYTNNINNKKSNLTSDSANNVRELTEDERRQRNENFLAKFNLLTMSKMKPVSTPVQKPVEEKKPEPKIDYLGKLNAVIDRNNAFIDDEEIFDNSPTIEQENNNIFNYVEENEWNAQIHNNSKVSLDKEIDFHEAEVFQTKDVSNEYIEEINTFVTPPSEVSMKRYENITKAVLVDKTYILNNKIKMVFGILLSIIMLIQITSLYFILNNMDFIFAEDKTIYIIAYSLVGLFALFSILPYFVNSNSHKANNFKLKYSFWFGILTFLVCSILIYCINALSGFEIDNFKYFATKILLPIILLFNFIIGPLIYSALLKSKSFYD